MNATRGVGACGSERVTCDARCVVAKASRWPVALAVVGRGVDQGFEKALKKRVSRRVRSLLVSSSVVVVDHRGAGCEKGVVVVARGCNAR